MKIKMLDKTLKIVSNKKFVNEDIYVQIPDDCVIPEGTKYITENGSYAVNSYKEVTVNVPIPEGYIKPEGTITIEENGTIDVTEYANAEINIDTTKPEQSKTTTPTKETQRILPDEGYTLNEVIVNPIPEEYIVPNGTLDITENGEYNITEFENVNVNINTTKPEQTKSTTPTKNTQTILPDEGYVLNKVVVNPIPEQYIIPETEEWTFTLDDGTEVVKQVLVE